MCVWVCANVAIISAHECMREHPYACIFICLQKIAFADMSFYS